MFRRNNPRSPAQPDEACPFAPVPTPGRHTSGQLQPAVLQGDTEIRRRFTELSAAQLWFIHGAGGITMRASAVIAIASYTGGIGTYIAAERAQDSAHATVAQRAEQLESTAATLLLNGSTSIFIGLGAFRTRAVARRAALKKETPSDEAAIEA